jgi:hypothetical protein
VSIRCFNRRCTASRRSASPCTSLLPNSTPARIVAQRSIEGSARSSVFAITARPFREGAELLASAAESITGGATGSPQSGLKFHRDALSRIFLAIRSANTFRTVEAHIAQVWND